MTTDEYVPSEDDVRMAYLEAHVDMADPITRHQRAQAEREAEDAWTAFLARVRRDAAREALTSMEGEHAEKAEKARVGGNPTMHSIELVVAEAARQHRDTRHAIPEESP